MKEIRVEIDNWRVGDFTIEKGVWADTVLRYMPRESMLKQPIILGKDDDGLVVEWWYLGVIFTLARATVRDTLFGDITAYGVQKIEELTYE